MAIAEYPFSGQPRKQCEEPLKRIEQAVFASTNSSLGWKGTAASPFSSFYASDLHQKAPDIKVIHLVEQINILRKLRKDWYNYSTPQINRQ